MYCWLFSIIFKFSHKAHSCIVVTAVFKTQHISPRMCF